MGSFPIMKKVFEPFTEFLRFSPSVAMITVAVIWFGIGESSKVFLIAYTTVFIVIINTAAGVLSIHPDKLRAARTLGASRAQIFFFVSLPAAMPEILTGLRVAMGNSFTTIVAAEMIAADRGLGQMLWTGRLFMLVEEIFVSLLVLGMAGFAIDRLFRAGIHRFGGKYSVVA
jgi:NitT/TauT family transport system permease protein